MLTWKNKWNCLHKMAFYFNVKQKIQKIVPEAYMFGVWLFFLIPLMGVWGEVPPPVVQNSKESISLAQFYSNNCFMVVNQFHVYSELDQFFLDTTEINVPYYAGVRIERISGDSLGFCGLVFRGQNPFLYYALILSSDHYSLVEVKSKKGHKNIVRLINKKDSTLRRDVNDVMVYCSKDSVILFINHHRVAGMADRKDKKGRIGMYADANTHVHFSDLWWSKTKPDKMWNVSIQPDTLYDLVPDSLTKIFYDFYRTRPDWSDNPYSFFEKGTYRIKVKNQPWYNYLFLSGYPMENFSFYLNFRIHTWDSSGWVSLYFHNQLRSDDYKRITIDRYQSLSYYNEHDQLLLNKPLPMQYDSGTVVRLWLEVQDADLKLTINDMERILIMDEQGTSDETMKGHFKLAFSDLDIEILSIKINSRPFTEDYGLKPAMETCAVYRLVNKNEKDYKPFIPEPRNPVTEFWDDVADFFEDWLDEWEGWFFVFWAGVLIGVIPIFVKVRRRYVLKSWYKKNFEKTFQEILRKNHGSIILSELMSTLYPIQKKDVIRRLQLLSEKRFIHITVLPNEELLIEKPEWMIVIPEPWHWVPDILQKLFPDLTIDDIKKDTLELVRMLYVREGRISIEQFKKEYEANPKKLYLFSADLFRQNSFDDAARHLFQVLMQKENNVKNQSDVLSFDMSLIRLLIEANHA